MAIPAISRLLAMGRRMKFSERFTLGLEDQVRSLACGTNRIGSTWRQKVTCSPRVPGGSVTQHIRAESRRTSLRPPEPAGAMYTPRRALVQADFPAAQFATPPESRTCGRSRRRLHQPQEPLHAAAETHQPRPRSANASIYGLHFPATCGTLIREDVLTSDSLDSRPQRRRQRAALMSFRGGLSEGWYQYRIAISEAKS